MEIIMLQLHTIEPVYDRFSRILILGSFPSVKSREYGFFYGHPQNRFWKVLAAVFGEENVPSDISEKKRFLLAHRVALWDVIASCDIEGSSDGSIKNVVPNDVMKITSACDIERIFVNGKTAERLYKKHLMDAVGRDAVYLPSTSSANASLSVDDLTREWKAAIVG